MDKPDAVFFDLDHTLWDYERNASETLGRIFEDHELFDFFNTPQDFIRSFHRINHQLWHRYNFGEIDRDYIRRQRFYQLLLEVGIEDEKKSLTISDRFIDECPGKPHLIDGAVDLLDYLFEKYPLAIITNGFTDTQSKKIRSSGIEKYFEVVVTSESADSRKPFEGIFKFALQEMKVDASQAIMIGDNLSTDIEGANHAGIRSIWFTEKLEPGSSKCPKVQKLNEIKEIL